MLVDGILQVKNRLQRNVPRERLEDLSGVSTIIDNGHRTVQRPEALRRRFVTSIPLSPLPQCNRESIFGNQK